MKTYERGIGRQNNTLPRGTKLFLLITPGPSYRFRFISRQATSQRRG